MARGTTLVARYLVYWLATAALFGVAVLLAWGSTPIALALWSVVALPLALSTRNALMNCGYGVSRWTVRAVGVVWVLLVVLGVGLIFADAALAPYEEYLQWAAAVFAGAVTAWGIWATTRPPRARDGSRVAV